MHKTTLQEAQEKIVATAIRVEVNQETDDYFLVFQVTDPQLKKRIKEHNNGLVFSTELKKPYKLVHYESFIDKDDAFKREKWLKTGWGRNQIKVMLENYLKTCVRQNFLTKQYL